MANRTAIKKGQKGAAHPATKHGAKAEPPAERVAVIYAALAAAAPVREGTALPPADQFTAQLAARSLARLETLGAWLDEHGILDGKGKPRSAFDKERRLQSHTFKLLASLGMTPASRARLGVDLKRIDLATAMSTEDPELRGQRLRELGIGGDDQSRGE